MTRRLVIFVNGDFTIRENGSHIRMAQQLDFARSNFPGVAVYSHRQHPSHPWGAEAERRFASMFPDVELILEDAPAHLRWVTRAKNVALALFPRAAPRILRFAAPGGPVRYGEMRARADDFVFLVNFVDGYTVLNGFPFASIIETHDIRFIKHAKRTGRQTFSLRVLGKMRSELAMLRQARAAIAISPVDRAVFGAMLPDLVSFLVTNFRHWSPAGPPPDSVRTHDLLFVGANNIFNVEGITRFIQANRAWLDRRSILIAGRVCEAEELQRLAELCPKVTLLGFVEDLAPVYASVRAILSPVEGTGLKIKVVEGLAHGKPVLGSDHSRDALPAGWEECVFPLDRRTAEALLDDPQRLADAEKAARAYYAGLAEVGDRDLLCAHMGKLLSRSA